MPAITVKIENPRKFVYVQSTTTMEDRMGFSSCMRMLKRLNQFERISYRPEAVAYAMADAIRRHTQSKKFVKVDVPGSPNLFVTVSSNPEKIVNA